jgi:GNAT superfamily N-acetyltransferase
MISIRRLTPDDWRDWRNLRLAALREAPYAFGSALADWQGAGDTEERWRARLMSVEFNAIALLDQADAGMVSGSLEGEQPELISMWVVPSARGRGVGDALIGSVIDWARSAGRDTLVLQLVEGNEHAAALYRRNGFEDRGLVADADGPCERLMALDLLSG